MKMNDTVGPLTDYFGNVILDDVISGKLPHEYLAFVFTEDNFKDMFMCNKISCENVLSCVYFVHEILYNKYEIMAGIQFCKKSCQCYFLLIESHFQQSCLCLLVSCD